MTRQDLDERDGARHTVANATQTMGTKDQAVGKRYLGLAVAAVAWGDGVAVRAGFGVAQEGADALVQFGADDVFKLAGLVTGFGVVYGEGVFEEPLGQAVAADYVAGAAGAGW